MNKKKIIIIILVLILLVVGITFAVIKLNKKEEKPIQTEEPTPTPTEETDLGIGYDEKVDVTLTNDFNLNMIKLANKDATASYLISPYSIETAFSMLREGANNNSLTEIKSQIENIIFVAIKRY